MYIRTHAVSNSILAERQLRRFDFGSGAKRSLVVSNGILAERFAGACESVSGCGQRDVVMKSSEKKLRNFEILFFVIT